MQMTDWHAKKLEFMDMARRHERASNFAAGSWLRMFGQGCDLLASDDQETRDKGSTVIAKAFSRFVRDILMPEMGKRMRGEAV
jgi:hypothetical protein